MGNRKARGFRAYTGRQIVVGSLVLGGLAGCALEVDTPSSEPVGAEPKGADAMAVDTQPAGDVGSAGGRASVGEGEWTLIVLPDTQIYAREASDIFEAQVAWVVSNRNALHVVGVLHLGDIVDDNSAQQWARAKRALAPLDGVLPYLLVPGNHDYGTRGSADVRQTKLSQYFPVDEVVARPTHGGLFDPQALDNRYQLLDTPSGPWLCLGLEFGPRDAVVRWANDVLARHPSVPTVLITHAFLYSDNTRYDRTRRHDQRWSPYDYGISRSPEGVNDGEALFRAVVEPHDQVQLVLSGHVLNDGVGRLTSLQRRGGRVHQLLSNYQFRPRGGEGYLRILRFDAAATGVDVSTYSPVLDAWLRDSDHQFRLVLTPVAATRPGS